MKIVFTGGGTGGHFYPLIAVAEAIHEIVEDEKIIDPTLYYIGPHVLDERALAEQDIVFKQSPAGKWRRYFSANNFLDILKTIIGIIKATLQLHSIYPDVVFSKGGYASFPTTYAARLLTIPVVVHESDAVAGRANTITSKWARAVAISYPGTETQFPKVAKKDIALIGNPIRSTLWKPAKEGSHEFLELKKDIPTLLVLGGSQGAEAINEALLNALPELLNKYQVIHQTGSANYEATTSLANVILDKHPHRERYRPYGFLNALALRMSAGVSSLVISRAGSGTIFEIAAWGIPSIIIPIPEKISHDQTKNAFAYARSGAATVVVQENLSPHILVSEVSRIMNTPNTHTSMSESAKTFARPDAAKKIARMLLNIGLEHES